jgi:hypothetical protein
MIVGALLIGVASVVSGQDADEHPRTVQEKTTMVRLLGLMQRGRGYSKQEIQVKSQQNYWAFARGAMKASVNQLSWDELQHVQNAVFDSAFGTEGTAPRSLFNPDVVAEFSMHVKGPVGTAAQPCKLPLPEFVEPENELSILARQVAADGTRPGFMSGHHKAMYFVKMSANVPAGDRAKTLQALHAKTLQAMAGAAPAISGFEILERLPADTTQPCGADVPMPDLVVSYWFKTTRGSAQFPAYARALRAADQPMAMNAAASFYLLVEEWESRTGPQYLD